MASSARPATAAAASVSGAFGLPADPASAARCSFDQARRRAEWGNGQDLQQQDKRMVRTFVNVYGGQESYTKEAVMAAVEECMKKQAEGLLHSLEGIGGRLSQLELYCYKLERSIGELRSDVMDYHSEGTVNFRCLEKNLRQVQKSVQILQDKHELAETPKELSKLQIAHEFPARANEASAFSTFGARENDHSTQVAKHEVAFVPLHQVNAMQSPAMPVQSSNGYILQQLVPVSLSTRPDHQQPTQAAVYYMQSQNPVKCTESEPSESAVHVMQPQIQNPEARVPVELSQKSSQVTELYPQPQDQRLHLPAQQVESQAWRTQPLLVQPQQYNIQQVPSQLVQQQTSSPQAQSAPQVVLYPPYSSLKPVSATTEPLLRNMVVHSPYPSPQQKHHEAMPSFYGQGNTVLLPSTDLNIQHQHQQPQPLQPHSLSSCPPQPSKPNNCSVASYAVQGSGQTYSATFKNPSNCAATVVAVLPQHPASAPMAFHHLGPQVVHNQPFGNMFETASVVGYPRDRVESIALPVVTAAQPADTVAMADKLNAGSNVTSPREWSG
ncbi:hypothetical protein E2562_017851 [Oryza meyeriana var. granulata]|uniref:DUF1421 domain-containing protein n=1 Tax=Oryza meyeriana var. granulata TaxID=110450 RepID=A0A6G1DY19_9ORYZ|nr:hypothetical protein E2562_017851 [Oryza meyeriana var. granulata]